MSRFVKALRLSLKPALKRLKASVEEIFFDLLFKNSAKTKANLMYDADEDEREEQALRKSPLMAGSISYGEVPLGKFMADDAKALIKQSLEEYERSRDA